MINSHEASSMFVGSWSLKSWTMNTSDGRTEHPFGEDAVGMILYTNDGHMAAHLMRRRRTHSAIENARESTLDPTQIEYISYCGPYSVREEEKTVAHHVEAASITDWVDTDLVRRFRFSDDSLTLIAATPDGSTHTLIWVRN
jgi:Lipocalin-like domain